MTGSAPGIDGADAFLSRLPGLSPEDWSQVRSRRHLVDLVQAGEVSRAGVACVLTAVTATRGMEQLPRSKAVLAASVAGMLRQTVPRPQSPAALAFYSPFEDLVPYDEPVDDFAMCLATLTRTGWEEVGERFGRAMETFENKISLEKGWSKVLLADQFQDVIDSIEGAAVYEAWVAFDALTSSKRKAHKFVPAYMPFARVLPLEIVPVNSAGGLLGWLADAPQDRWEALADVVIDDHLVRDLRDGAEAGTEEIAAAEYLAGTRALETGPLLVSGEPGWRAFLNVVGAARMLTLGRARRQLLEDAWASLEPVVPLSRVAAEN